MLFFSYFKDLLGKEVTMELKNDLAIRGTLHSVDQYINIKLENTHVVNQDKYLTCKQKGAQFEKKKKWSAAGGGGVWSFHPQNPNFQPPTTASAPLLSYQQPPSLSHQPEILIPNHTTSSSPPHHHHPAPSFVPLPHRHPSLLEPPIHLQPPSPLSKSTLSPLFPLVSGPNPIRRRRPFAGAFVAISGIARRHLPLLVLGRRHPPSSELLSTSASFPFRVIIFLNPRLFPPVTTPPLPFYSHTFFILQKCCSSRTSRIWWGEK